MQSKVLARQKLHNDIWVDLGEDTGATDHAHQMAAKFHSKGETTLVFCSQRRIAVHQAKLLLQELDSAQQSSEQKRLADAVAQYLGLKHPLIKLISHGIAYHHSLLPPIVQRLIEHGVRHRIITTLFTTTTLREGINLPARNVLIAGEQYFNEEFGRTVEMDVPNFVNISGRAGRPHLDTYGVAILVPNQLAKAFRLGRKYFLYGPDSLAVASAMERLITAIQEAIEPSDFETLRPVDQALILSLYASGIREEDSLKDLFERTLAYSQMRFDSNSIASFCVKSSNWIGTNLGKDKLEILARLGFGLEGSRSLDDFVSQHLEELSSQTNEVDFGSEKSIALAKLCIEGCKDIPELRVRTLKNEDFWSSGFIYECATAWVNGESLPSMAEKFFITKGDANKNPDSDPVVPEQVVGKVVFRIPKIGWVAILVKGFFTG